MAVQSIKPRRTRRRKGKWVESRLVDSGNLFVVDRDNLDMLRQEMNFQLSGEVSDESAVSIGRILGAQTIIFIAVVSSEEGYRLRLRAIAVETAAIQGIQSFRLTHDNTLITLTSGINRFALNGQNVFAIGANGMCRK